MEVKTRRPLPPSPGRVYLPVTLKCLDMLAGKHRSVLISPSAISLYMLTDLSPVDSLHVPFAHCETTLLLLVWLRRLSVRQQLRWVPKRYHTIRHLAGSKAGVVADSG